VEGEERPQLDGQGNYVPRFMGPEWDQPREAGALQKLPPQGTTSDRGSPGKQPTVYRGQKAGSGYSCEQPTDRGGYYMKPSTVDGQRGSQHFMLPSTN
jgi:hypothetical protein